MLKKEKGDRQRAEITIHKMEIASEIEKRNLMTKTKSKAQEKYNIRVEELQKKFKLELT